MTITTLFIFIGLLLIVSLTAVSNKHLRIGHKAIAHNRTWYIVLIPVLVLGIFFVIPLTDIDKHLKLAYISGHSIVGVLASVAATDTCYTKARETWWFHILAALNIIIGVIFVYILLGYPLFYAGIVT